MLYFIIFMMYELCFYDYTVRWQLQLKSSSIQFMSIKRKKYKIAERNVINNENPGEQAT